MSQLLGILVLLGFFAIFVLMLVAVIRFESRRQQRGVELFARGLEGARVQQVGGPGQWRLAAVELLDLVTAPLIAYGTYRGFNTYR